MISILPRRKLTHIKQLWGWLLTMWDVTTMDSTNVWPKMLWEKLTALSCCKVSCKLKYPVYFNVILWILGISNSSRLGESNLNGKSLSTFFFCILKDQIDHQSNLLKRNRSFNDLYNRSSVSQLFPNNNRNNFDDLWAHLFWNIPFY